jgi:hypothetical protein
MNVRDLIEELEQMDPEAVVIIASQPAYPLENAVDAVVASEDDNKIVFLAEGEPTRNGYLPEEDAATVKDQASYWRQW